MPPKSRSLAVLTISGEILLIFVILCHELEMVDGWGCFDGKKKKKETIFILKLLSNSVGLFGSSEQESSEQRKVQRELGNDWVP